VEIKILGKEELDILEIEDLFKLMREYKIGCFKFGRYEIHKPLHEMPVAKLEPKTEPDPFENIFPK
jgi:hypothetical protein